MNVEWANNSFIAPVALTNAAQAIELVPDAMAGLVLAPDFLVKRIAGILSLGPQSAATASVVLGLAIIRSVHGADGAVETIVDPLSTDVDSGSQDILWQQQLQPDYGGALDATGLDFQMNISIDLRGRPTLRKLDKRHGIQLVHRAETSGRVQLTMRLRILGALSI